MPPFRLELPDKRPPFSRLTRVLYTKNAYSEGVKVEDWQHKLFAKPIDYNPLCPGEVNQFRSHYNRLGAGTEMSFSTTTGDSLKQTFLVKIPTNNGKFLETYYSFNDAMDCSTPYNEAQCPEICNGEYMTTMQYSYRVPHPYAMQRLAFPKIPYMQNQKYRNEDPRTSSCKFYDESFPHGTRELQKYKGFRWKSYNFMTGK